MMKLFIFFLAIALGTSATADVITQSVEHNFRFFDTFRFDSAYRETVVEVDSFDPALGALTSVEVDIDHFYVGMGVSIDWYTVDGSDVYSTPGDIGAFGAGKVLLNEIDIAVYGPAVGIGDCILYTRDLPASEGNCSDGDGEGINHKTITITEGLNQFISPSPVHFLFISSLSYSALSYDDRVRYEDPFIDLEHEASMSINYKFSPVNVPEPNPAHILLFSLFGLAILRKNTFVQAFLQKPLVTR